MAATDRGVTETHGNKMLQALHASHKNVLAFQKEKPTLREKEKAAEKSKTDILPFQNE